MSTRDEVNLSLNWSDTKYSLAEFVDNIKLPQVIIVHVGHYSDSEKMCIGRNEILTMHTLQTHCRLVGEDSSGKPITVSLDCPVKVMVNPLPMVCRYKRILTNQMQFVYPKIKYFRVCEGILNDKEKTERESVEVGSILELKLIDSNKRFAKFENVGTKMETKFSFGCNTVFEPLLDCEEHTVRAVVTKFGLPVTVHFLKENSMKRRDTGEKTSTRFLVNRLGKVNLLHEIISDTKVIATTVVGRGETKACLELSKDICMQVRVCEEYLQGEKCYHDIVQNLHQQFDSTSLTGADDLDMFEYLEDAKTDPNTMVKPRSFVEQPDESLDQQTTHAVPDLPKRNPTNNTPPSRPPKTSRCISKNKTWSRIVTKVMQGVQNLNLNSAEFSPPPPPSPRNQGNKYDSPPCNQTNAEFSPSHNQGNTDCSPNSSRSTADYSRSSQEQISNQSENNKEKFCYVESEYQDERGYTCMDNRDGDGLDMVYETVELYDDVQRGRDGRQATPRQGTYRNRPPPSLPPWVTANPDCLMPNKCETEAINTPRFPKDLSGLTVEGVGRLLQELRMGDYVSMFNKEMVDGEMLMTLDAGSMAALNMNTFHIKKLKKVIEGWRPSFSTMAEV